MKKLLYSFVLAVAMPVAALAQSGTNSPYSQYGLGKLSDLSTGMSRAMNGVGIGMREHNLVNYLNPASYSGADSLTFLFDIAMSLQKTNFKENGRSKNANNGDFEYAVASFRAMKGLGISFGLMPYTNIGYNYSSPAQSIISKSGAAMYSEYLSGTTYTTTYSGSGGIHQIYVGAGWEPIKNFSVGMNLGYLFGNLTNNVSTSFSDGFIKKLDTDYTADVSKLKFDFGASYTHVLDKKRSVTVGITFAPEQKLGSDSECRIITQNNQSGVKDTSVFVARNAMSIPMQIGAGVSYKYGSRWLLGMDYVFQKWESVERVPYLKEGTNALFNYTDAYSNRHKLNFGGQYCKNEYGRSFVDRLRYRFGVGYSTSYLKINDKEGPKELSVSAGVGIPIVNSWNNRSILNVGFQWQHASAKDLITENTFLINIGVTFNERWFAKWEFE